MSNSSAAGAAPFDSRQSSAPAWTAERQDAENGDIYWAVHRAADYGFVANVYSSEKDARLIAAAPDLLAACRAIDTVSVGGSDTIALLVALERVGRMARAAIAKAEALRASVRQTTDRSAT